MAATKVFTYPGEMVDITWDGRLCIHVGECAAAQGKLFVAGRQPWCQPDLTTTQQAIGIVKRCPSGALTFHVKQETKVETPEPQNKVQVVYNGPLFVSGDLNIENAPADMPGVRFRAALCRCGASKNKPFCDNSHLKANFNDYGAVGETGAGFEQTGGKLTIKPVKDGPIMVSGNFTIVASSGRLAWQVRWPPVVSRPCLFPAA